MLDLPAPPQGPMQGAGRLRRVLPFAVIGAATIATFVAANWTVLALAERIAIGSMVVALCTAWMFVPWDSLPRAAQAALPLGVIAIIVAMQVFALPNDRDFAALMLVPVLWSALYGSAREAATVTLAAITAIVGLHAGATIAGVGVGFTGWTEVVAMTGGLVLLAGFTVSARAHARSDPLTGVANRRAWDDVLHAEIDRAHRYPTTLTVALIDLDLFKAFNDTHGHAEGDRHLAACTTAWSRCLRESDTLARIGGEEFAVLLVGSDEPTAADVLRRVARATPNAQTCSIGVAQWDGAEDAIALTGRADDALYAAKEAGRDRIVVADAGQMHAGPPDGGPAAMLLGAAA